MNERLSRAPGNGGVDGGESGTSPGETMGNRSEKFHLNHHRGLLAQVVVFFAAFLYVLVDGFALNPYRALEAMPWFLYPGAALVLAAFVIPAGRKAPTLERVVVAAITIGAATAAAHPLALRVNAATGTDEQVRYTWAGEGRFETEEGDYPPVTVDIDRAPDYWEKTEEVGTHPFTVVKGSVGIHQLDTRPVDDRIRTYRELQAFGNLMGS